MNLVVPDVDFVEFHRSLAAGPRRVITSPLVTELAPIAFVLPNDRVVTYRLVDGEITFEMHVADDADTVVEFSDASFSAFASEYLSAPGVHIQQMVRYSRGGFGLLDEWEPLLRFLYNGRPVYDPTAFADLDTTTEFVWGRDSLDDIARSFRANGYAVVRKVFTAGEVAVFDAELDRLAAAASPTDGESWWVTGPDGIDRVCQLHYTSLSSPSIAALEGDARVRALVDCADPSFVAHPDHGNGHFAVLKNPGVQGGLTDLAWHVDCGLGGHPVLCPSMHLGVQVRPMNAETGEMQFLAGSHLATARRPAGGEAVALPIVRVTAEPGDVTLHFPDAMHAAPPPAGGGPGRRTIYLSYGPASLNEVFGHKEGYDQMLFKGDGHVGFDHSDNA